MKASNSVPLPARLGCAMAWIGSGLFLALAGVTGCTDQLRYSTSAMGLPVPADRGRTAAQRNVAGSPAQSQAIPADPSQPAYAMRINGEEVTAEEIVRDVQRSLEPQAASLSTYDYEEALMRRAHGRIIDRLAEELLHQAGSARLTERELARLDEMAEKRLREIVSLNHDGVMSRFERELAEQGRTIADARSEIRREFVIAHYLDSNVRPKLPDPTREELHQLFVANKDRWRKEERRRMSLIEIRIDDDSDARPVARERAEKAKQMIAQGEPFEAVAREFSDGAHGPDGGSMGWIKPDVLTDRLTPAVEALYALPAGGVSPIIETAKSFFIVRCDEIEPGLTPTFVNIQSQLRAEAQREEFNRLIAVEVEQLRQKALIEPENLDRFLAGVLEEARNQG